MDGTSDSYWPAMLFTILAIVVALAAVFMGRNKAPAPSECSHQTSTVVEERAGSVPGVSSQYHDKQHRNESTQQDIQPQSTAKSLKDKDETIKREKDSNSDIVEKICKSDSPVHTSTSWGEDSSESGIRNALRDYAQSSDAEKKPLRYMSGMLRTCQLEKMMTKEELEEEQRSCTFFGFPESFAYLNPFQQVQGEQLAAIFQLIRDKQDTFGEVTESDLQDQLKLYSI